MANDKVGYIYILTNESFHQSNWIKIGYTENIQRRLKSLYNTSLPTPFEVYATYEVPASSGIADKSFHQLIEKLNPDLRLNSNREFFEIEPWDAYDILEAMAKIHGRMDKLVQNRKNAFFSAPEEKSAQEESYCVDNIFKPNSHARMLFEKLKNIALSLYPDLNIIALKYYTGFKKGQKHNVISIWPKSDSVEVVLNAKRGQIDDEFGITYDISNRRWPAAQYAFRFNEQTDTDIVENLITQTYKLVDTKKQH